MVKNPLANAGDVRDAGSIPGSGRSPGRGHGSPLQYTNLDNPTDRGAWRATVHGVTKSWTRPERPSAHRHDGSASLFRETSIVGSTMAAPGALSSEGLPVGMSSANASANAPTLLSSPLTTPPAASSPASKHRPTLLSLVCLPPPPAAPPGGLQGLVLTQADYVHAQYSGSPDAFPSTSLHSLAPVSNCPSSLDLLCPASNEL